MNCLGSKKVNYLEKLTEIYLETLKAMGSRGSNQRHVGYEFACSLRLEMLNKRLLTGASDG